MTKETFNPFRLEDLTGGINVRDYESEIEDKQVVDLVNYNFSGNKLVSEKGSVDSGLPSTANIGALTIDSGDIWTVSAGDIKKNGTIVSGGVGILVTTSLQTFKPGVAFYITIEGVPYTITGNTVADFIFNLKTAVEANGLITVSQDDIILIKKADGSVITYSTSVNKAYILYDFAQADFSYGQDYYWEVMLNGITYSGTYTMSSPALNQGQADLEMIDDMFTAIPGSIDKQKVFLDSSLEIVDTYTNYAGILFNGITSISSSTKKSYNTIRINGYSASATPDYSSNRHYSRIFTLDGVAVMGPINYRFGGYGTSTINWTSVVLQFDGRTINVPNITSNGNAFMAHVVGQISIQPYAGTYCWTNWEVFSTSYGGLGRRDGLAMTGTLTLTGLSNGTPFSSTITAWTNDVNSQALNAMPFIGWKTFILNDINSRPGYYANEDASSGTLGIHINKDNLTFLEGVYGLFKVTQPLYRQTQDIRGVLYQEAMVNVKPLSTGTGLNGRSNITIGNLGSLVVDKDVGGAYYSYDNLKVKIGEDAVGFPTVGTIYNGKIVLGGFNGNDNIIFSKTSSPTQPLNVLNFTDYSAGGQSVSGGDKGLVTGMMVGENGLYVFKDNSIWYTNSEKDDPTSNSFNFVFNKITSSGALTQNVITEVQQEIFYLDWKTRAVRRLGYEQNLTTLRDTAISDEIRPLLETLPEDQRLATSQFSYPNYMLSLSDHTGGTITYPNGQTFHRNNIHFIYNVDNKSWTRRTGIIALISDKGYYVGSDGKIYKDFQGNTGEDSVLISKLYTFGDDVMYKKYGQLDIVGKTIGAKDVTVEIYVDGEKVDERTYNYNNSQIREKIDMYDVGQGIQWKITASGAGKIELYDIQIKWKPTTIQPQDYL